MHRSLTLEMDSKYSAWRLGGPGQEGGAWKKAQGKLCPMAGGSLGRVLRFWFKRPLLGSPS